MCFFFVRGCGGKLAVWAGVSFPPCMLLPMHHKVRMRRVMVFAAMQRLRQGSSWPLGV